MVVQSIAGGILYAWYPVVGIIGGGGSEWWGHWGGVWQDSEIKPEREGVVRTGSESQSSRGTHVQSRGRARELSGQLTSEG
jgi:hypothetical protein